MKFVLKYVAGFTADPVSLEAHLVVGGRGSITCEWSSASRPERREVLRHDFGLAEAQFRALQVELERLPDVIPCKLDDMAFMIISYQDGPNHRSIECPDFDYEPDVDFPRFHALWDQLMVLIQPVLTDLGMPAQAMARLGKQLPRASSQVP